MISHKDINHNFHKKFSLMCSECLCLSEHSISMFFDKAELSPDFNVDMTNEYYCNNCKNTTLQYDIDSNIAKVVRLLNLHGFKTQYSCQGHYRKIGDKEYISAPYIRFKDRWKFYQYINMEDYVDKNGNIIYIAPKSKILNNINWKIVEHERLTFLNSFYYDLRFDEGENYTGDLNTIYEEACNNLYRVLLEILIDHETIMED